MKHFSESMKQIFNSYGYPLGFKLRDKISSINNLDAEVSDHLSDSSISNKNNSTTNASGVTITPDMYQKLLALLYQDEENASHLKGTGQVNHISASISHNLNHTAKVIHSSLLIGS